MHIQITIKFLNFMGWYYFFIFCNHYNRTKKAKYFFLKLVQPQNNEQFTRANLNFVDKYCGFIGRSISVWTYYQNVVSHTSKIASSSSHIDRPVRYDAWNAENRLNCVHPICWHGAVPVSHITTHSQNQHINIFLEYETKSINTRDNKRTWKQRAFNRSVYSHIPYIIERRNSRGSMTVRSPEIEYKLQFFLYQMHKKSAFVFKRL